MFIRNFLKHSTQKLSAFTSISKVDITTNGTNIATSSFDSWTLGDFQEAKKKRNNLKLLLTASKFFGMSGVDKKENGLESLSTRDISDVYEFSIGDDKLDIQQLFKNASVVSCDLRDDRILNDWKKNHSPVFFASKLTESQPNNESQLNKKIMPLLELINDADNAIKNEIAFGLLLKEKFYHKISEIYKASDLSGRDTIKQLVTEETRHNRGFIHRNTALINLFDNIDNNLNESTYRPK